MPMKLLSRHLETSTERLSSFSNSSLQMSIVTIETCEQSLRRCAEPVLDVFHWLTFQHRIAALVWRCLLGLAPAYIRDLCYLTPGTRGRSSLLSMERGTLFPFARTSTSQTRAFSVVGP